MTNRNNLTLTKQRARIPSNLKELREIDQINSFTITNL